ncbi:MAG: glycosyltransferase [Salinivirgaceae bacterium]|nr:glycosyltransferase [Salinivirgaceae bacterium]
MKVLFICSQNNKNFDISPFIQSQADSIKEKGIKVDVFIVRINKLKGVISNVKKIRRLKKQYDILHAHYSTNGFLCLLAGASNKLIVSYLGSDLLGINNSNGSKNKISIVIQFISYIVSVFSKAIIVKTDQMKKNISSQYYKKTQIIPNGVDFDRFYPIAQNEAKHKLKLDLVKKIVLFLGNPNDSNKNYSLAKLTFGFLPQTNYLLVSPYPTNPEKIPLFLNAADVLILTSISEGSANVIKEALACNTPIVTVDVGDASVNVQDVYKAHVVPYDPNKIAGKIIDVCKNSDRSNGRSLINHLEISIIADRIIAFYRTIFNG